MATGDFILALKDLLDHPSPWDLIALVAPGCSLMFYEGKQGVQEYLTVLHLATLILGTALGCGVSLPACLLTRHAILGWIFSIPYAWSLAGELEKTF